ncbi:putative uncharacterized protein (plasmid) [Caballeronia insecticola]|uniref:DUF1993 domain-containing protein n=2 Tax=Caballeronia insecticola TaxID=758793 RepID=A0A060PR56_9BURK|nr:DUF1993 family protein [Caballeronia insecticola]BAO94144.1 putative uncharacterized protein [Caballeronia insecticola]
MHRQIIEQCASAIERMDQWMAKAERHAMLKGFDVEVLMNWQLAPDMAPFSFQIQSACTYLESGIAGLTGLRFRSSESETNIAGLRALIREIVGFARGVTRQALTDVSDRMIKFAWLAEPIDSERFVIEVVFPNVYFHVGNAYAILSQGGVDVGKRDYIGPIYPAPR